MDLHLWSKRLTHFGDLESVNLPGGFALWREAETQVSDFILCLVSQRFRKKEKKAGLKVIEENVLNG